MSNLNWAKLHDQCLVAVAAIFFVYALWWIGYEDANYFAKAFRKVVGVSPREYRRRRGAAAQSGLPGSD